MKRLNLYINSLLICLVISWSACKRAEVEPLDIVSPDLLWDTQDANAVNAQSFLRGIYNTLPNGFNRINSDYLDNAGGDAITSRTNVSGVSMAYFTNGALTALNYPDSYFTQGYNGIREANIFLANIDKVPLLAANPNRNINWKAEVRFIRAFHYWQMVKRYGGVPLVGDKVFDYTDNLKLARNTFDECVNYIVAECDAIKPNLRAEAAIPDAEYGTIPKGAAVALKMEVQLFAASPLYNGGGIETNAAKKVLTGYPTADASRWQKVVDTYNEFVALGYYNLNTTFLNSFIVRKNTEVILAKQSALNFNLELAQGPVGFTSPNINQGLISPTQDLVNAFPTIKGMTIGEDVKSATNTTGYDAANPYANRDPRLALTIFYNGATWLKRAVETFEGGRDKPNTANTVQTKTGYYLRKFLGDFANGTSYSNQSHNFAYFRFGGIVLNYAEALNEIGQTESAVTQIGLLRKRAGITASTNNRYGIKAGITQTEMRTLIQTERRVELAFEEDRFYDVRRWKIADQVLQGPVYGAVITKDATTGTLTYNLVNPVTSFIFSTKLYHMPLPYDEVLKNPNLLQNEGW